MGVIHVMETKGFFQTSIHCVSKREQQMDEHAWMARFSLAIEAVANIFHPHPHPSALGGRILMEDRVVHGYRKAAKCVFSVRPIDRLRFFFPPTFTRMVVVTILNFKRANQLLAIQIFHLSSIRPRFQTSKLRATAAAGAALDQAPDPVDRRAGRVGRICRVRVRVRVGREEPDDRVGVLGRDDEDHPDPAVERARHLRGRDAPRAQQPPEHGREPAPRARVDRGREPARDDPRHVLDEPAARDVREALHQRLRLRVQQRAELPGVDCGWDEQRLADGRCPFPRLALPWTRRRKREARPLDDLAHEGEPVRMEAG